MATTLVTCRICKTKIDRDIAYKVGKNRYFCSEEEYIQDLERKEKAFLEEQERKEKLQKIKDDVYDMICVLLGRKTTNTMLFKELAELNEIYTYDNVYTYIYDNFELLEKTMDEKTFSSEYGEIRYLFSIIKNNINDYLTIKKDEIEENEYIKYVEYDIPEIKYKSKNKRRSLYEIEMELTEDE